MRQRAYSLLNIKSAHDGERVFVGVVSTPETDRQGDQMVPGGAVFRLPMPLLRHHSQADHVGEIFEAQVTRDGIVVKGRLPKVDEPGLLKDRVDEAWHTLRYLSRSIGLSIGWQPVEAEPIRGSGTSSQAGLLVKRWLWFESSLVTIPANASATILSVKQLAASPAASGTGRSRSPGVSGSPVDRTMNISEQIQTEQQTLQTKAARLEELEAKDGTEGGLESAESTERDALTGEIEAITGKLKRLQVMEAAQVVQAKGVSYGNTPVAAKPKAGRVEIVNPELPKGTLFTRYAMAKAAGKGSLSDTLAYARRWDSQTPEVSAYIKAEAGASVFQSPGWGSELVYQNNLASEFVELVRPMTIIGRAQGFRNVPFNVRIPVQSGGSTVNWVGEAAPKPVTELAFTTITVPNHKMAGIVVLTDELIRLSSPAAEAVVRRDLTEQIAQFRDAQFIQVAVSAGANNPASITNGVSSPAAGGTTLADLMDDLSTAIGSIVTAGNSAEGLVIATTSAVALRLSMMVNALGQTPPGFAVTPTGGTLLGYPVIVSDSVDSATLVIFKPSEIFLADDGRVSLDASNQATLDMSGGDDPDFNLWQRNCTAIRAEQWITWVKRRAGAVAVIDTIAYVPGT
jgi:HK97 family phage major capsid protein